MRVCSSVGGAISHSDKAFGLKVDALKRNEDFDPRREQPPKGGKREKQEQGGAMTCSRKQ